MTDALALIDPISGADPVDDLSAVHEEMVVKESSNSGSSANFPAGHLVRRMAVLPRAAARFDGAPRWLVIFADLVALLIAFFVLMLSMSAFKPEAIAQLNGLPAGAAGAASVEAEPAAANGRALPQSASREAGAGARYLAGILVEQASALGAKADLSARPGGAVVILPASVVANASEGTDLFETLQRLSAAAPGRVSVLASSAVGDASSLYEAASSLPVLRTAGVAGVAVGVAGWLDVGSVAIAIRDARAGRSASSSTSAFGSMSGGGAS